MSDHDIEQEIDEELPDYPSGRELRRVTKAATNAHAGDEGVGKLLNDVYYQVIAIAIAIAVIFGAASALRGVFTPTGDEAEAATHTLTTPSVIVLMAVAIIGGLLSLAARLGPVGMGGAQGAWWLPLPVDRRSLLRPAAHRFPWMAGLVTGVVAVALYLFAGEIGSFAAGAQVAAFGILVGFAIVYLVGVAQSWWIGRRTAMLLGDTLVVAAPATALVWAFTGFGLDRVPVPGPIAIAIVAVVVLVAGIVQDIRLGRLASVELRERGAAVEHAAGAAVSMDSRELGRALSDTTMRARRRRSSRMRLVRGPYSAIVVSDLMLLLRSPRRLVQLLATAFVPIVVVRAGSLDQPLIVFFAILLSGYMAAIATAEGSRRAEMAPALDALMPLAAADVRKARTVTPAIVMALWTTITYLGLSWARDGQLGLSGLPWLVLGVLTTPVWAGAAVRAAYRRKPDWSGPLISTPAGALPPGVTAVFAQGPDIAVLGSIPVGIALVVGGASTNLIIVQAVVSAVAYFWGTRTRTMTEWSQEAQKSPEYQEAMRRR